MHNIDGSPQRLDVGLNNGRSYVQGSEMLAQLVGCLSRDANSDWQIERASFHRITDRLVEVDLNATALDLTRHLAHVSFGCGDAKSIYFLQAGAEQAPKRHVECAAISPSRVAPEGGSLFDYSGASCFWQLLDVVVQACKAHSLQAFPQAYEFMFTALFGNNLPLFPADDWTSGKVEITELRRLDRSGVIQTMNRFRIDADSGLCCEGSFGFAFRLKGQ